MRAIDPVAVNNSPGRCSRYAKQGTTAYRFKPVGVYRFESISRMEQNVFIFATVQLAAIQPVIFIIRRIIHSDDIYFHILVDTHKPTVHVPAQIVVSD